MTLNEYIIKGANKKNDENFILEYGHVEVFCNIVSSSQKLEDGPVMISEDLQLKISFAELEFGNMALFYTSKEDKRLTDRFAGVKLIDASAMVSKMQNMAGLLIQSNTDAWIAIPKNILQQAVGSRRA